MDLIKTANAIEVDSVATITPRKTQHREKKRSERYLTNPEQPMLGSIKRASQLRVECHYQPFYRQDLLVEVGLPKEIIRRGMISFFRATEIIVPR